MSCPHCHQPLDEGATFCGACGMRIHGAPGLVRQGLGRSVAPSQEETRKVFPDAALIQEAAGERATTRRMAPDSRLLRMLRGQENAPGGASGDLGRSGDSGPGEPEGSGERHLSKALGASDRRPSASVEDTAFLMEAALRPGRSRLAVLLVADACLLLVGIYLIVSWARQPIPGVPEPVAMPPGARGYISWEDDGEAGRIATGPIRATFEGPLPASATSHPKDPDPVRRAQPEHPAREPASMEPASMESASMEPASMGPASMEPASMGPASMEPASMEPASMEPASMEPAVDIAAADQAERRRVFAEQKRVLRAREGFLKLIPGEVRRKQKEIRRCYEQVLTLRKGVQGDVDVEFDVAATGEVTSARTSRNTTGSATLGSCIAGVFMALRLPPPPGGPVVLRYPFRFTPRSHR